MANEKMTPEELKIFKEREKEFTANINEINKNKGWYKVINLERPGDPIEIGFNAQPLYQFEDQSVALIPHAVAEAINNAKKTSYKNVDNKLVPFEKPRYQAFPDASKEAEIKASESKSKISDEAKETFKKLKKKEDE